MRWFTRLFLLCAWVAVGPAADAADAKIIKVLPHFLDLQGRHTLSPSLYERDAYQLQLRQHPEQRSAVRFDIHWRAPVTDPARIKLRVEVRGSLAHQGQPLVLEAPGKSRSWLGRWTEIRLEGGEFQNLGDVVAWRATLWDGEKQLAEQTSFLW